MDLDRNELLRMIALATAAILVGILFASCDARGSVPEPPKPDPIIQLGNQFITWGGLMAGLALVAGIARFFAFVTGPLGWILGILGPFIAPLGYLGASAVGTGYAFLWVGYNPWLVALAVVLSGVALWIHRNPAIRRRLVAWAEKFKTSRRA